MVTIIRAGDVHARVWLLLAIGFAFLSFDEMLQFHEHVSNLIARFAGAGIFRNWNDIIVLLYGFIALSILIAILPGLLRWRTVAEMFAVGFVF